MHLHLVVLSAVLAGAPPSVSPPPRAPLAADLPAFTGTAALIAGSGLQVASAGLHIAAFELMTDTCALEQSALAQAKFAGDTPQQAEREIIRVGGLGIACLSLGDQAVRMRIGAGLAALGGLSLVTTGALLMGRSDAAHDVVLQRRTRRGESDTLVIAGATTLAGAFAGWLGTRIAMAAHHSGCGTIGCFAKYDILTFQISAAIGTVGAGMLAWGAAYGRRAHVLRAPSIPRASLVPSRGGAMISISGRF